MKRKFFAVLLAAAVAAVCLAAPVFADGSGDGLPGGDSGLPGGDSGPTGGDSGVKPILPPLPPESGGGGTQEEQSPEQSQGGQGGGSAGGSTLGGGSKLPPAYDGSFWSGILDDLQDAQPGDTVTVAAYLEKNIPAFLLEALAQQEEVTLELDYYFYTLAIPSSRVKPVEAGRIYYPLNDLYLLYTGDAR